MRLPCTQSSPHLLSFANPQDLVRVLAQDPNALAGTTVIRVQGRTYDIDANNEVHERLCCLRQLLRHCFGDRRATRREERVNRAMQYNRRLQRYDCVSIGNTSVEAAGGRHSSPPSPQAGPSGVPSALFIPVPPAREPVKDPIDTLREKASKYAAAAQLSADVAASCAERAQLCADRAQRYARLAAGLVTQAVAEAAAGAAMSAAKDAVRASVSAARMASSAAFASRLSHDSAATPNLVRRAVESAECAAHLAAVKEAAAKEAADFAADAEQAAEEAASQLYDGDQETFEWDDDASGQGTTGSQTTVVWLSKDELWETEV